MKLTVISAAFNVISSAGEEKLERSIRSVAAIPIEHEHLIIDGASTDGTVEVLRRFEAEIPSLKVVSEKDSGIYEALNKGFLTAQGEYIYILGLDDKVIEPRLMAKLVERANMTNADMCIAPVMLIPDQERYPLYDSGFYTFYKEISYSHQGAIVRKDTVLRCCEGNPFDLRYKIAADYKQLLTLHWNGAKAIVTNRAFAEFVRGGISSNQEQVRKEVNCIMQDVLGIDEYELSRFHATGSLPLRVVLRFAKRGSAFSRRMALKMIANFMCRKHKYQGMSTYYFIGLPIYKHKSKRAI